MGWVFRIGFRSWGTGTPGRTVTGLHSAGPSADRSASPLPSETRRPRPEIMVMTSVQGQAEDS